MPDSVRMPALGQTTDELRIVEWLKAEGDTVELGEPLLAVETDKATLEVESAVSGTLLKILHGPGATVQAGSVVAYVGEPGEALPDADEEERREHVQQPARGAPAPEPTPAATERPIATPAARQLAREHGLDLRRIRGSGPGGVIEKKDVLAFIERSTRG